jgi:hypothetical protein
MDGAAEEMRGFFAALRMTIHSSKNDNSFLTTTLLKML